MHIFCEVLQAQSLLLKMGIEIALSSSTMHFGAT